MDSSKQTRKALKRQLTTSILQTLSTLEGGDAEKMQRLAKKTARKLVRKLLPEDSPASNQPAASSLAKKPKKAGVNGK
jgi:hypothetical protein